MQKKGQGVVYENNNYSKAIHIILTQEITGDISVRGFMVIWLNISFRDQQYF